MSLNSSVIWTASKSRIKTSKEETTTAEFADCPTPWPCFVIAVRNEFLKANKQSVALILETINNTTIEFKDIPSIDRTLASKYHQKLEDIQEWLSLTKWSQKSLEEKVLNNIQNQLFDLKIIDKKGTFVEIVKAV